MLLGLVLQVLPGRESIPATVSRHLKVRRAAGVQGFQERSDDQANDGRRAVLKDDQGINLVDPLQVDHLIHGADVAECHVRNAALRQVAGGASQVGRRDVVTVDVLEAVGEPAGDPPEAAAILDAGPVCRGAQPVPPQRGAQLLDIFFMNLVSRFR